jgi:hypothetical protein
LTRFFPATAFDLGGVPGGVAGLFHALGGSSSLPDNEFVGERRAHRSGITGFEVDGFGLWRKSQVVLLVMSKNIGHVN